MRTNRRGSLTTLVSFVALLTLAVFAFTVRGQTQETAEEEEAPKVAESELQMYIDVYTAMQADHSLQLADALKARGVDLEQFRDVERRIHRDQRYVDRVRKALLEYAKGRMTDAQAPLVTVPSAATPGP